MTKTPTTREVLNKAGKATTKTNRRGTPMVDGRQIIRDNKRANKPQRNFEGAKNIAIAVLTVSIVWLMSWTWYFAVS